MANKKMKIGEILVSSGLVTEEQLVAALSSQAQIGGTVGENLIRLGFLSEELLLNALSEQTGLQHINLARVEIPASIQRLVQLETVRSRRLLPIGFEGKRLVVGMVDPTDLTALSEVEFQSGHPVKPVILSASHFEQALRHIQSQGYGENTLRFLMEKLPRHIPAESSITSFLQALVTWRGQDLHLSSGAIPSIRVDGEIRRLENPALKSPEVEEMVQGILTPEQKRLFQENLELDFAYSLEGIGRFRCNLYRQRGSIAFTARHVADKIPPAAELGIPDFLSEYALRKQGLILVTGPNGHGKTTTLANLVDFINRERKANIITIEDPIEYTHKHKNSNVNQREVGTDTLSFADGLRHIFRQNPDVIVIGELRDYESFSIALSAAETGHLVMATMHSMNATAAVDRIIDIFPSSQQNQVRAQLSDCLLVVFSQRLLRRTSGSGRVLAWERMSGSLRVRNAIREGKVHLLRAMMQTNVEELVSIDWNLAELVASGKVRYEEALKYADSATYLNELLKVRGAYR
ncbi:MAG TPA: PilT/PilU family type 4a pilus ATPase [Candidatus Deferrimicrobiaceae bacterium]|nr:PilT/PilU family type 4a pilus ATPase [Candidatus Deferrimicrobiaceae bacterium]